MQQKNKGNITKYIKKLIPLFDVALVFIAAALSLWLRGSSLEPELPKLIWILGNVAVGIGALYLMRVYSIIYTSVGIIDAMRILVAAWIIGCINVLFSVFYGSGVDIGIGVTVTYTVIFSALVGISRFSKRIYLAIKSRTDARDKSYKKVLIVGGGEAGCAVVREMLFTDKVCYRPVCIADDDPSKQNKSISGVTIAGTTDDIGTLVKKYGAEEIFIAIPSLGNREMQRIVEKCNGHGVPVKCLPGMYQLADGQVSISKFRHVEIEELLGRDPVDVNLDEIIRYIEGEVVLVTGGGGSIGSELCRQIAKHNPKKLIILDIYENNAYEIEQELKRRHPELDLLTLIASVRDKNKIRDVFKTHQPSIVFNAAAHKHVPLMETSPNEAVKNNVFGTLNVARAADEFGAKTFVQISTDKAVNPTNIMGATKRICEMIIQTIGRESKKTKFVAVRFGNVLGSNGSVIPLFKKQIEEGGPVTVTHKDIIRYFMTIPEAVSLVLQAGAYAEGGEIFVLDMGEPVRIYDLAENLIKLSGLVPGVDIEIVCTGLRPGEKLFEERLMKEEGLKKTPNGLISIARPIPMDESTLFETLDRLYDAAYSETDSMKELVRELVPTYVIDVRERS